MLCDIRLPRIDGLTLFRRVRQESPGTDVILITAHAAVADAVAALKEGAYDYITKPFDIDEIILQMERIGVQRALKRELEQARAELSQRKAGTNGARAIIGRSPPMLRLSDRVETIAQSDAPVLITGESGTGKELIARTLHERSRATSKPFIAVNCAAFPETLLEAELFGHERGAFTGAVKRRDGRFKAADGGTLLLDEVAEVPLPAQAKLLRVLQEGTVEPLGTNEVTRVDVRIISATHRNLRERIREGKFREDLYYRLNVLDIEIPPLRERRGDLPLLLQYFLNKFTPPGRDAVDGRAARLGGAVAIRVPGQRARVRPRDRARRGAGGRRRDRRRAPARRHHRDARRHHQLDRRQPALAGGGDEGVRARIPAARAGAVQRQEDEGRRDPRASRARTSGKSSASTASPPKPKPRNSVPAGRRLVRSRSPRPAQRGEG